jgi:hypothetical protein
MNPYHYEHIRALLTQGFTEPELRRLCHDHFRPVYDAVAQTDGKEAIADRLIEYTEQRLEVESLLALAAKQNPARYQAHAPYHTAWHWEHFAGQRPEATWPEFDWHAAATAYCHRMADLYGTTRVLGKPGPVPLEGIFTDLFILDRPTAFRRFDIFQLKADPDQLDPKQRMPGLKVVTGPNSNRLFLLGQPGAGKTTFLKYLTLQAVQGKLDKTPIMIGLKEWSDSGLTLMPFIVKQFEICAFPDAQPFIEQLLESGQALVLFDGLDEVNVENSHRARITVELKNFGRQYLTAQCLITCRIAATDYAFEQFTYVEMADFDEGQIKSYAHNWFKDDVIKRDKFLEELLKKEEHKGLRDLGRTPLLLSLLCLSFEETMSFPRRRVEIYEEALDALLKKWDALRSVKRDDIYYKLSLGRKRHMLARIAAETFEEGAQLLRQEDLERRIVAYLQNLPPADANEDIDGEAVLKAIESQHGIFAERAHRIYSFSHLTFQEYFTAKYIADNAAQGAINGLIVNHLTEKTQWSEVFLLTASLLDDADDFFVLFRRAVDNLIAADELLVEILAWAEQKAAAASPSFKPAAARAIYLFLTLDLTFNLTRLPDLDRVRDLALNLARVSDLTRVRDLALGRSGNPTDAGTWAMAMDMTLTDALKSASVIDQIYDTQISKLIPPEFVAFWAKAVELGHQVDSDLSRALTELKFPTEDDGWPVWKKFERDLWALAEERALTHCWELNGQQLKRLANYLEASKLLVDCLELAYVSNRTEIEQGLLRPPGNPTLSPSKSD